MKHLKLFLLQLIFTPVAALQAADLYVSHHWHHPSHGLFFTRPEISEKLVYYVPVPSQSLKSLQRIRWIGQEEYEIYEARVYFKDHSQVDFKYVLEKNPIWKGFYFTKTDVSAQSPCKILDPASETFFYYQKTPNTWQRSGQVSSTEPVYCNVMMAFKKGDSIAIEKAKQLAKKGNLVDMGIEKFNLIYDRKPTAFDLSKAYRFLKEQKESILVENLSKESALIALGASFSLLDDQTFKLIQNNWLSEGKVIFDSIFSSIDGTYRLNNDYTGQDVIVEIPNRFVVKL